MPEEISATPGVNLPDLSNLDWIAVLRPAIASVLVLVTVLGHGEADLEQFQALRFRPAPHTRTPILKLVGEAPIWSYPGPPMWALAVHVSWPIPPAPSSQSPPPGQGGAPSSEGSSARAGFLPS